MTTLSLADLVTPPTSGEIVAAQLALMTLGGLPTTSWQDGSVPLTLIQADADTLVDLGATIANIANGGFLTTAPTLSASNGRSPWLDLCAANNYSKTRLNPDGIATQGTMVLTDAASAGPFTIAVAQLIAQSSNGLLFQNTTGGTLSKGSTLSLTWQSMSTGSSYNLPAGTTWTLVTPLPGVTLTNPSSTWITQQGVDPESDASLVLRCQAAWPGLGGGATVEVYQAWALESTAGITRSLPLENTPSGGKVTIYLAGDSGGATAAQVSAAQAYIDVRRPLCVTVACSAAANNTVTVAGTVYVSSSFLTSAQAAFTTALTQFQTALALGGTIYGSTIVELLQSITGVRNVSGLTLNGTTDVTQTSNQVAVFVDGITWTGI